MEMMNNKWVSTVASIWIQSTSGTPSTFGIYSPALKSSQGYSQSTLGTVALFKDLGANVGILAGVLYATTAYRRSLFGGPKVVILAGALQCFAGYFLTWLSVTGVIYRPPVPVMCLFMLLAGHAMPFFNTADVVTAVHNFRDYSGTAIGIMKRKRDPQWELLDDCMSLDGFACAMVTVWCFLLLGMVQNPTLCFRGSSVECGGCSGDSFDGEEPLCEGSVEPRGRLDRVWVLVKFFESIGRLGRV